MSLRLTMPLLFSLGLLLIGCERKKPELIQAMEETQSWSVAFTKRYPDPIPPFPKSPSLLHTGNIGITKNLHFILLDFPADRLPELEAFVRTKLKAHAVDSVTILTWETANIPTMPDVVRELTLKYYADGRTEDSRVTGELSEIPEPNINGRPIPLSEQDAGGKRDVASPDSLRSETADPALPQL